MARKKKKKKDVVAKVPLTTPESNEIKSEPVQSGPIKNSPKSSSGVSLSTCLAGMFLTLLLGLYLGSLIPELKEKFSIAEKMPTQTKPVSTQIEMPKPAPIPQKHAANPAPAIPHELTEKITHVEKHIIQSPRNADLWAELGNLYFDANLPDKAIHAYEQSLAIKPDNADTLTDLGIMYREKEDFARAIECFRKASQLKPGHQNALFNEGVVFSTDLHDNKQAIEAWNKLLNINPDAHGPNGQPVREMIENLR